METLDDVGVILILGGSLFDLPPIIRAARKLKKLIFVLTSTVSD